MAGLAAAVGHRGGEPRVLTKGVVFNDMQDAKGNPFRNRLTRLGGVSVLTVMTTPTRPTAGGTGTR